MSRRRIIKAAGALAAGIAAPVFLRVRSALAAYPIGPCGSSSPIRPAAPRHHGRIIAAALEQSTGKTFIIENRGGAGGNIGMGHVATSEPDGYTILLATNAYSVNLGLYNKLPYDPFKDFVGVSELASSPNTFVVRSELPAKTVKEFAALAKANPEKFNVAVPPIGTTPQLQAEVLKSRENMPKLETSSTRVVATHCRRYSAAPRSFPPARSPAHPHIKAGTLRCLAISSEERWPDLPDVPTMQEAGYKDFVFATDPCCSHPPRRHPKS